MSICDRKPAATPLLDLLARLYAVESWQCFAAIRRPRPRSRRLSRPYLVCGCLDASDVCFWNDMTEEP
jgi:hypothetical protein